MDDDDIMPKSNDRKRVKDRIIEGVAKAVKHIQSYQLSQPPSDEQVVVLKNSDWQFHKLVENLDHAFLYGLRHFTDGYWVIVQEFTHKSTIDDITKMSNIMTNLGRSRAWLYLALSDHLLESYILCFMKNAELVRKHYVKEALVLDEQRMQLLLTLSSGLELIAFDLEVNVQYLDLCSCFKVRTESQEEDEDNLSLCSMISSQSQGSSMDGSSNQPRLLLSPLSILSNLIKPLNFKPTTSSLTLEETEEEKKLRIESFANTEVVPVVQSPEDMTSDVTVDSEVEVIRVKPKRQHTKRKDRCQKPSSTTGSDNVSLVSCGSLASLLSPHGSESSGYRSDVVSTVPCVDDTLNVTGSTPGEPMNENNLEKTESAKEEETGLCNNMLSQDERLQRILDDQQNPVEVCFNRTIEWKPSTDSSGKQMDALSPVQTIDELSVIVEATATAVMSSSHPEQSEILHVANPDICDDVSPESAVASTVANSLVASTEEPSIYDNSILPLSDQYKVKRLSASPENCNDISAEATSVSSSTDLPLAENQSVDASTAPAPIASATNLTLNDRVCAESHKSRDFNFETRHSADIEVDNNLKVVLMLDIFLHEDESLIKMFRTCQGHTQGEILVTYIVITNHSLYLLKPSNKPNKFLREVAINYKELDYVSISLNSQVLHIVCHVRHNQFWITTGDELLTRHIVSNLEHAVLSYCENSSKQQCLKPLAVLTDATAQKISISKWVAKETGKQQQDVALLNYSLVHWEDSEAIQSGDLRLSDCYEGVLYYKDSSPKVYNIIMLSGSSWNRGYFVLEHGMLHQYADKHCSGTPLKSISLTPSQCYGCRRCNNLDRKHCFEIRLADGSNLELSASSETEVQEWITRLCQATCDQTNSRALLFGCIACCSVVTQTHLFMCHEDLQTNFLRTLGVLPLSSLIQIQTDSNLTTYCVLISRRQSKLSGQEDRWCIYFNSTAEQKTFVSSIINACIGIKQSTLPLTSVDPKLSKRCRAGIVKLNQLHGI